MSFLSSNLREDGTAEIKKDTFFFKEESWDLEFFCVFFQCFSRNCDCKF